MTGLKGLLVLLMVAIPAMSSVGCSAIKHKLDSLSDDELAMYVEEGAKFSAKYAISMASKKWPDKAAQIKADAIIVDSTIRQVVIPAFSGIPTFQVLSQILQQVSNNVKNTTLDSYEIIFQSVLLQVPLPPNPADKLSPRTSKVIVAFFTGIAEGIEQAEGLPSPTPVPPPPPDPVPPK